MKHLFSPIFLIMLIVTTLQFSCKNQSDNKDEYKTTLSFKPGDESKIIEAFLSIKDSTRILLKQGVYKFDNLSIAQVNHIQIQGDGYDKTILDFKQQSEGGEGIRVTDVKHFVIDGMTIRDSKGDLLKIARSRDVTISNLHAVWSKADSTSGGYAIYPVMCKKVLIENCYAEGSSDAGIYVGQTDSAIVRTCKATKNVAGCEIENTSNAQVYGNEFHDNTAGFLVFDLPGLSKRGGHVKAHNNNIHDNNCRNFAKSGSFGTSWGVGNASPGTGVIILAASNIEIYNNSIVNNNSSAITIASGFAVDTKAAEKINANYFPISKNISIHDNEIKMGPVFPEPAYEHHIGKLLIAVEKQLNVIDPSRKNKRIPFIMYDGISSNVLTKNTTANPDSICIKQTGDNVFVNADFFNIMNPKKWQPNTNMAAYTCK
ncbi:parallel beta-helix repeat-containing protein [Mucilaginibacter mallensis]|uniref:Parallel beta-helix repeat-containing protein n=1 Tax=Mucilaginibacter mallensis TaxID=652787 RepID=A0A1H1W6C5_MUCMA|nr:parallel beta-helix domain-containing protein [Mucilaginibacter mallensis]SDS92633.1 parallel beta-helix repeat-containing protein [Mucilaginibacter mallensis]